ncbi:MAG: phosphate ABC transporter permease subunit PstC [Nibricoccus sp.]
MSHASTTVSATTPGFAIVKARTRFFGLTKDECIETFFGGNALVAVVVLALITIFLFREGYQFFAQNHHNLTVYRRAGLEYVDIIRQQETDHAALTRYLSDLRLRALNHYLLKENLPLALANARLSAFDDFAANYGDALDPLRSFIGELSQASVELKEKFAVASDKHTEREQLLAAGRTEDAAKVVVDEVDFKTGLQPVIGRFAEYKETTKTVSERLEAALTASPSLPTPELEQRLTRFKQLAREHLGQFPAVEHKLEQWNYLEPVPFSASFSGFIFGRQWLTASFWQDWYGVLPLFTGSLLVSIIALVIAVPLGVAAAIYVNQIATTAEQKLIKPCIEFISAIPSVVLGFFGIAILGTLLRSVSQVSWLSWVPGFPMSERLNALTAGCLLALLSVPTIFTLAEDAINNVPRAFKEASFALGASRLQTIVKIVVPAGLSGIISAVLLGFGRVMGETMVVLLCAGNRIAIPDFTAGLGVFTQPVHTMTGIIAQEMGEVPNGSIHYRALFMVGVVLFFLALAINYAAQGIVRRYKISIG